jgi:hypothetical protein
MRQGIGFRSKKNTSIAFVSEMILLPGESIVAKEAGHEIGKDVFIVGSNGMSFMAKMEVPLRGVLPVPSIEHIGYQAENYYTYT